MAKGDPRKPKGKMSSYAYFVQTCREEHKKKSPEIPVSFSEFSKRCSARWKAMSDKEKSRFDDMAKQDKVRYDQEMMHYMPGGKRGKKKDPNAPKRPSSGFFLFCSEHRPQIKAQYPSLGIGDVAKKLGEMWNGLTDATKQPYLMKANKLKDKYQKACLGLDASVVHHVTYHSSSILQYNNISFLCRMLQTTRRRARLGGCPWAWE
uniref:High mobility group protein B3-like n=1 Tax=Sinocyclocheilus anshuiensis TaxID=1608454 RepID=A0A671NEM0_9TELE